MNLFKKLLLLAGLFGLLTSCAKPPTEEMNRAIEALTRAENNFDAVNYAGNTLGRAREALQKMQEEAGAKRYETARMHAADAAALAERAVSEGRTAANRMREEAAAVISGLVNPLAQAEEALDTAKTGGIDLDFNELEKTLEAARLTVEEAQQSLSESDYRNVIEKCRRVRSELSGINSQINEAAQALNKKL